MPEFISAVSERALFVIDSEGKIHWSYVSLVGVNPGSGGNSFRARNSPKQRGGKMKTTLANTIPASKLTLPIAGRDHIQGPIDTPSFFINGARYDGARGLDALLAAVSQPRAW